MEAAYAIYQNILLWVCLAALGAVVMCCLAVILAGFWDFVGRLFSLGLIQGALCFFVFLGFIRYGATKPTIRWDVGLYDDGSEITNNTVAIRWRYSGIPSASTIYIDYRPNGSTNEWQGLGESVASALAWNGTVADATNYDYYVYSTYIPPVPVHTNGVWVGQAYETKARSGAAAFLILNGKIKDGGRTIAPPSAKRKDGEGE